MANKNKEKKNTKVIRTILFILIAIIIIAAIAVIFFKGSFGNGENISQTESVSQSVTANSNSGNNSNANNTTNSLANSTSGNSTGTTAPESTAKPFTPAKNYSLPLNVKEVLDILSDHYGKGYEINSTVTENEYNYFAVIKDGEKYASVRVNLSNGDATETIIETGSSSDFNLV